MLEPVLRSQQQAAWIGYSSGGVKTGQGDYAEQEGQALVVSRLSGKSPNVLVGGAGVANSGFSYLSWGHWSDPASLSSEKNHNGAWLAGSLTNGNNIPGTGSATFHGSVLGTVNTAAGTVGMAAGTHSANVNFGTRNISGSFTNIATLSSAPQIFGGANYTASWASGKNQFIGSVTPAVGLSTAPGAVAGGFYGPTANEMGGRALINKADGTSFNGVFTGKR